jgi:glycosyltransferase involved in cell wall biosynthesis
VLLKALLATPDLPMPILFLDIRSQNQFQLPTEAKVNWLRSTLFFRSVAEFQLRAAISPGDIVLCFHGLPPLLPNQAKTFVFVQNRLNLERNSTRTDKPTLRTVLNSFIFRTFSSNADIFIVQTLSMHNAVQRCIGRVTPIKVLPFLDKLDLGENESETPQQKCFDFIYVADGVPHKNHVTLLDAWVILAKEGIKPSLVLTLGIRDQILVDAIEKVKKSHNLQIHNVGAVSRERVFNLYRMSRALIFPSKIESFGIPLVEAVKFGLPIIASELDYVRDVCIPIETFDPDSPVSIARAIKRFLNIENQSETMRNSSEFIEELFK